MERVAPGGEGAGTSDTDEPAGDLWVYTSMYRPMLDALDPVLGKRLQAQRARRQRMRSPRPRGTKGQPA